jgi:hypothetical protein
VRRQSLGSKTFATARAIRGQYFSRDPFFCSIWTPFGAASGKPVDDISFVVAAEVLARLRYVCCKIRADQRLRWRT